MLPRRDPPQNKRPTQPESEGLETNFPSKMTEKQTNKAGVAMLISDKIDFKTRAIKRDPEGHFIMLKGRIQQEDINIVCSQHRSTQIHKENLGGLQERYRYQHNYSRGF